MNTYTVILTPDVEMGGYSVRVPALPGCNTQGDTFEDALANAREAISAYLADLAASGEPVPTETAGAIVTSVNVETRAA